MVTIPGAAAPIIAANLTQAWASLEERSGTENSRAAVLDAYRFFLAELTKVEGGTGYQYNVDAWR